MSNMLPLNVTIPAEEWDHLQRRLRYLEAALVQSFRGVRRLKEWFSASDLEGLELRGLPSTRQGILRRAQHDGWQHRLMYGQGGERYEFHFSSLPRAAFDDLIGLILAPAPDSHPEPRPSPKPADDRSRETAAPQWALPLLRLVKREATASPEEAAIRLRDILPTNCPRPSVAEVRAFLDGLSPRS